MSQLSKGHQSTHDFVIMSDKRGVVWAVAVWATTCVLVLVLV